MAATLTFPGGISLPFKEKTANVRVREIPLPEKLTVSLCLPDGSFCYSLVTVGDRVRMGQVIARRKSDGFPIRSPLCGTVAAISLTDGDGRPIALQLVNDRSNRMDPYFRPFDRSLREASPEELLEVIREAGILDLDGDACLPAFEKLSCARAASVTRFVVNGIDKDPSVTVSRRLLRENPGAVFGGAKIVLKILGLRSMVFALSEKDKASAAELNRLQQDRALWSIRFLKNKYPQGNERLMTRALIGKNVSSEKTPADFGVVFLKPETCAAIYQRFVNGTPMIRRLVTVDGDCIRFPGNYWVPFGVSLQDLLASCGGLVKEPAGILLGGLMIGKPAESLAEPLQRNTDAVLLFSREHIPKKSSVQACFHCGRCSGVCPAHLMPLWLREESQKGNLDRLEELQIDSCMNCGCCTFVCPAGLELASEIQEAKALLRKHNNCSNGESNADSAEKEVTVHEADASEPADQVSSPKGTL